MGPRHQGRELALKALYRIDICGGASGDDLALVLEGAPADERARTFARQLLDGVRREQVTLDKHLADALEHWSIRRLSRVDHNILRIAIFELIHLHDIPARVTLDEAIELAKAYGDQESGRFVNGVLDEIAGRLGLKDKGDDPAAGKSD
jgi:transcription antitermination protein NusB